MMIDTYTLVWMVKSLASYPTAKLFFVSLDFDVSKDIW